MGVNEPTDLRQLIAILRRRLWVVITIPVLAAAVAGLVSVYALAPQYEASTSLWVVKKEGSQLDYSGLLLARDLTKTYAEVAQSRTVADATIRELGLREEAETLLKRMQVNSVKDTEILQIVVDDKSPQRAADIANVVAAKFMAELPKFLTLDNVRVIDAARAPLKPVRPRPLLNTAIAFVLGALLAVGGALLLDSLDVTLRTPEDVERLMGLPVLAMIPVIESESSAPVANKGKRRGRYRSPAPTPVEEGERQ